MKIKEYFKVNTRKNYQKTVFGFDNRFFRILKNTEKNYHFYGFYDFVYRKYRTLHKGIKIPITGLQITVLCIVFNLFWIPFRFITFLPLAYLDGMKNFIKDSAWYQNVSFFNWLNFCLLILLALYILLLKIFNL